MARKRNSPVTSVPPLRRSARIRRKVIASSPVKCTLDELRKSADLPKLTRLYQMSWPATPTDKVEKLCEEYVKFLYLKAVKLDEDGLILSPSAEVDGVWHQHILDTKSYRKVCETVGFNIDHDPEKMYDDRAKLVRRENTYVAYEEVFGEVMDGNFWSEMHELKASSPRTQRIVSDDDCEEKEEMKEINNDVNNRGVGGNEVETRDQNQEATRECQIEGDKALTIMLRDQTDEATYYKVGKRTRLLMVFQNYAERKGVAHHRLRFLFNGVRINDDQTIKELEMDDGDQIDVMLEQGGC